MTRKQYKEAAKTAVIIAREEQSAGNYRKQFNYIIFDFSSLKVVKKYSKARENLFLQMLNKKKQQIKLIKNTARLSERAG